MSTRRRIVRTEDLSPEARAKVEAFRASFHTPEARAEEAAIEAYYADRPSLETLIERGDVDHERILANGAFWELVAAMHVLWQERQRRGLSIEDIARLSGLDPEAVARLEATRNANPTYEAVSLYAAAMRLALRLNVTDPEREGDAEGQDAEREILELVRSIGLEEARRRLLDHPDPTPVSTGAREVGEVEGRVTD